jgi:AcrR family transcriptional regulator
MSMTQNPGSWRRRPKGDKRARTRAKLIEAAAEMVREKGYEYTTLDEVAQRAGMTRGAIHGNFKNKDELFLAIAATRWQPITPQFRPGASFAQQMRLLADAVVATMPSRHGAAIGFTSFQTYALTHEELRTGVVRAIGEIYTRSAEGILALIPQNELPMPAETLVRVLHALIEGLTYQRFLTPELVSDDVIYAAFDALSGVRRGGITPDSDHGAATADRRK